MKTFADSLKKCLKGPYTVLSNGCSLWLQWDGKVKRTTPFSLQSRWSQSKCGNRGYPWLKECTCILDKISYENHEVLWRHHPSRKVHNLNNAGWSSSQYVVTKTDPRKYKHRRERISTSVDGAASIVTNVVRSADVTFPTCFSCLGDITWTFPIPWTVM